jgi:hypothetical protein
MSGSEKKSGEELMALCSYTWESPVKRMPLGAGMNGPSNLRAEDVDSEPEEKRNSLRATLSKVSV